MTELYILRIKVGNFYQTRIYTNKQMAKKVASFYPGSKLEVKLIKH